MEEVKRFNRNGLSFVIWEGPGKAEAVEGDKRYYISVNGCWMPTNEEIGLLIKYVIKNNVKYYKRLEDIELFRKILDDIENEVKKKDGNN